MQSLSSWQFCWRNKFTNSTQARLPLYCCFGISATLINTSILKCYLSPLHATGFTGQFNTFKFINFYLQMCAWSPLFLTGHGLTLTLFPICPVGQVEEKSTQPAPLLGCPNILPNTLTQ